MQCKYCSGVLVWDYDNGEIVCSKCNIIYDKITTLEFPNYKEYGDNLEKPGIGNMEYME